MTESTQISNNKREGFLAHYSICASLDGRPLGTLGLYAWSRLSRGKKKKGWGDLLDPDRESGRLDVNARMRHLGDGLFAVVRYGGTMWLFKDIVTLGSDASVRVRYGGKVRIDGHDGANLGDTVLCFGEHEIVRPKGAWLVYEHHSSPVDMSATYRTG